MEYELHLVSLGAIDKNPLLVGNSGLKLLVNQKKNVRKSFAHKAEAKVAERLNNDADNTIRLQNWADKVR